MDKDNALIDQWVLKDKKYSAGMDVETAWDVLNNILGGAGILVGKDVGNALFNGCALISAEEVKEQALKLSGWTQEQVLVRLQSLDEGADIYHLEVYQEEEDDLLEQFDKLVTFYKDAAEKGWAALSYAA
jgi:hypothetical protein